MKLRIIYTCLLLLIITNTYGQCSITNQNTDLIISSNQSLSGIYNIQGTFRIDAGVTVTVTPWSSNNCGELVVNATNIEILGDIDANGAGYSGGTGGLSQTSGVNTTYLSSCANKDNCYTVQVYGGNGGASGNGLGAGFGGDNGTSGMGPKQYCGNSDDDYGLIGGAGGAGGGGGGAYGGDGSNAQDGGSGGLGGGACGSYSSCASPQNGYGGTGGVKGSNYGTVSSTDIDKGSGGAGAGGGGKSYGNGNSANSGGHGGGLVQLSATATLTISGIISANGNNGASGGSGGNGGLTGRCCSDGCNGCDEITYSNGAGGGAGSGGGAGGGIMVYAFGNMNVSGTFETDGGNGGSGANGGSGSGGCNHSPFLGICECDGSSTNSGVPGNNGGDGGGGRIKIFSNPCQTNTINPTMSADGPGSSIDGTTFVGNYPGLEPLSISLQIDSSILCSGDSSGIISTHIVTGTGPFDFIWSTGDTISGSLNTIELLDSLSSAIYSVTVSDTFGCTETAMVLLTDPNAIQLSLGSNIADCDSSDGNAFVQINNGIPPYSISWNDPLNQTTDTAYNLSSGLYTVIIQDSAQCMAMDSVFVAQDSSINNPDSIIGPDTLCLGTATNYMAYALGVDSFHWSSSGILLTTDDSSSLVEVTGFASTNNPYSLCVKSVNSCATSSDLCIDIIVKTTPTPDTIIGTTNLCPGEKVILSTTPLADVDSFVWTIPAGSVIIGPSSGTSINFQAGYNSGQVCVQSINECGTSQAFCINLNVTDTIDPAGLINGPTEICEGISSIFTMPPANGATDYTWIINNGQILSGQGTNSITASFTNSGSMYVLITNVCDTVLSAAHSLDVFPNPTVDFTTSNLFCVGEAIQFSDNSSGTSLSYLWDFDNGQTSTASSPSYTYSTSGNYQVSLVITDINGCQDSLTKLIQVSDGPIANFSNLNHCHKDSIYFKDQSQNNPMYWQWDFGDGLSSNSQNPAHLFNTPGTFSVELTVVDVFGCSNTMTQNIIINASPNYVTNPQDTSIVMGEYVSLSVSGGIFHSWTPHQGLDDSTIISPIAQPMNSTTYYVMIMNEDSCYQIDTVNIEVTDGFMLYTPNAFTPNGDGKNDLYKIRGLGVKELHLQIVNRWGEKVFESDDPNFGWDGVFYGKPLSVGTYAYWVKAVYYDGSEEISQGSINLFR